MDKSDVVTLLTPRVAVDEIGQYVLEEPDEVQVFCKVNSVGQSEFFKAGEMGFKASYKVTMNRWEYDGQELCVYNGQRFSIYRTFFAKDDVIELYLERKAGTK